MRRGSPPKRSQFIVGPLVVVLTLSMLAGCSSEGVTETDPSLDATGSSLSDPAVDLDPSGLPTIDEATLAGMVDSELALRAAIREESTEVLGAEGAALLESLDGDLAIYGRETLATLVESAGVDPFAASASLVGLSHGSIRPDWGGSMQAVSGNFTMSAFLGLVVSEWQRLSDSDWRVEGELPPHINDRVNGGVAEHSEMTTTVNGSTSGGRLEFEITVIASATLTDVASGQVIATYESNGHGNVVANGCPDAEGLAEGEFTLELEEHGSGVGGASAGGSSTIEGPFRLVNGDDARLVRSDFEAGIEAAGSGTGPSGESLPWDVEATYPISIPNGGGLTIDEANATYRETNAPGDRGRRATAGLAVTAAQFLSGVAKEAESFWRSGRCVDLTTSEESRVVEPAEELSIEVSSRHHFDQAEIEAPVTGEFTGKQSMDPASGTAVDYPASFTVVAGSMPGDKATVRLEQRSKRGIGKKTVEFEVKPAQLVIAINGETTIPVANGSVISSFRLENGLLELGDDGFYRGQVDLQISGDATFSLGPLVGDCSGSYAGTRPMEVFVDRDEADDTRLGVSTVALPASVPFQVTCGAQTLTMEATDHIDGWLFPLMVDGIVVTLGQPYEVPMPGGVGRLTITVTEPE